MRLTGETGDLFINMRLILSVIPKSADIGKRADKAFLIYRSTMNHIGSFLKFETKRTFIDFWWHLY